MSQKRVRITRSHAAVSPGVGKDRRRDAKTHYVRKRIKLHSKLCVRSGHPCDSPVQRIEQNRDADGFRGVIKIFSSAGKGGKRSVIPAKQIRTGHDTGQQKDSTAHAAGPFFGVRKRHALLFDSVHHYSLCAPTEYYERVSSGRFCCVLQVRPDLRLSWPLGITACAPGRSSHLSHFLPPSPEFRLPVVATSPPVNQTAPAQCVLRVQPRPRPFSMPPRGALLNQLFVCTRFPRVPWPA